MARLTKYSYCIVLLSEDLDEVLLFVTENTKGEPIHRFIFDGSVVIEDTHERAEKIVEELTGIKMVAGNETFRLKHYGTYSCYFKDEIYLYYAVIGKNEVAQWLKNMEWHKVDEILDSLEYANGLVRLSIHDAREFELRRRTLKM